MTAGLLPSPGLHVLLLPVQGVLSVFSSSNDFIFCVSESQGKWCRLMARASCSVVGWLFVSLGPKRVGGVGYMSEEANGMGHPCPPLLSFGFDRIWVLCAREYSWGKPPLAKPPMPEERKQGPAESSGGSGQVVMPGRCYGHGYGGERRAGDLSRNS